jgi:sugar lactone lactonase YvrE
VSTPAAVSTTTFATFGATATETGSTFEVSLDGSPYTAAGSPFTLSGLAQGAHSINVRARDAAGNVDATPATFSWAIDSLAPDTTLTTLTSVNTAITGATFTFASEAGATFEASVDGATFALAMSPVQLAGLPDGAHTFAVRARDAAGNVDATPAAFAWTVDTQVPDTAILSSPSALSNLTSGQFTFSSPEAGVTFLVRLDAGTVLLATSPHEFTGLANGAHTFTVRAIDAAGNSDASPATFAWTIDTVAPDTTISGTPAANSNSATATFTFTSEANTSFQASIDGAAYAAAASPLQLSGLASGTHTFNVRAIDAAGNLDATPASFGWQVDTSQPTAEIVFPTPVSYTDAPQLHVRGTAADAHTITGVTVNGVAATSADAFAHWSALVPIAAGSNTLVVRVTDSFGNTNTNAASAQVANRGVTLSALRGMAWDAANSRVLVGDAEQNAIVALRASDGHASVLSDATHGTGLSGNFQVIAVDATNNRAIAIGGGELLYVNLTNGNRTTIPTAAFNTDTTFFAGVVCNNPCTRVYSTSPGGPGSEIGVFYVDLTTGARTVVTGGSSHLGSGPTLINPTGATLDATQTRLLVTDNFRDAVMAVDLTTGVRSVLSTAVAPAVGSGPAFDQAYNVVLDSANNRVLVANHVTGAPNQLIAVNLANGNRTLLPLTGTSSDFQVTGAMALDSANSRLFLSMYPRANVVQVNLATNQQTRFADSNVGTGPMLYGGSVLIDNATPSRSLLTNGTSAVVRVDLATGARSVVVATTHANGTAFSPQYLQFDTRPGIPANRLFYTAPVGSTTSLYSADLGTGIASFMTIANIPFSPHPEIPLDAANSRLLINVLPAFNQSQVVPVDVVTGTRGLAIADSGIGTPAFGQLNAMALENAPGVPQRIIAMDAQSIMYGIDTATGNRTIISASAGPGTGPTLAFADAFAIDPATRRALAVSSVHHSIQEVDLLTGNRTLVSGLNLDTQATRGAGPSITQLWSRVAADFDGQVAYVTSNSDSILCVDLVSGDRVLTAR